MKKIIAIVMFILTLCFSNTFVYANVIDGADSTVDISTENQMEIIKYLNELLSYEIAENDVDFKKAYKTYVDVPELLDYDEISEEIIKDLITEKDYCYCVAVHTEDEHVEATLNRDSENENHWKVISGAVDTERFDYFDSLNSLLEKNEVTDANVYLFGGVNGKVRTVAAVCRGNDDVQFLILYGSDEEENMYNFTSETSRLYSYDEIKHIASLYVDMPDQDGGGDYVSYSNNSQYAMIACGVVLAVSALAIIIKLASKKKKYAVK